MTILAGIEEVDPAQFDALDRTAGAVARHAHLAQRQVDARWRVSYLRATGDGTLKAVIPLYASRGEKWPDPAYAVDSWPLPAALGPSGRARACLLVGGCSGGRSSLHVERGTLHQAALRELIAEVARFASGQNRCLAFPFMNDVTRAALAGATGDNIAWTVLRREAQLRGVNEAGGERCLGSRVAGVLRRDLRLMAAAGVARSVRSWLEVEEEASKLIAEHNVRMGTPDHPEYVRVRYTEWQECEAVELVVFVANAQDASGVLTALVSDGELDLREIGLVGEEGPARLATYLDLVFHHPLAFARSRGLSTIRAGSAAEVPKKSRGAVFENLYGGVLDLEHTRRLAREA